MVNFTAPSPFPHQIQSGALNDLNRRELIKNMKKEEMDRKEGDGEATEGAVEKPIVKKQKTGESNERILRLPSCGCGAVRLALECSGRASNFEFVKAVGRDVRANCVGRWSSADE